MNDRETPVREASRPARVVAPLLALVIRHGQLYYMICTVTDKLVDGREWR